MESLSYKELRRKEEKEFTINYLKNILTEIPEKLKIERKEAKVQYKNAERHEIWFLLWGFVFSVFLSIFLTGIISSIMFSPFINNIFIYTLNLIPIIPGIFSFKKMRKNYKQNLKEKTRAELKDIGVDLTNEELDEIENQLKNNENGLEFDDDFIKHFINSDNIPKFIGKENKDYIRASEYLKNEFKLREEQKEKLKSFTLREPKTQITFSDIMETRRTNLEEESYQYVKRG